jgi:phosphocarrier protein
MDSRSPRAAPLRRTVTIVNRRGLHARAAARFVKVAAGFEAKVMVAKNGTEVSGLSIMGLMMLAAGPGTEIEIRASGTDAALALAALETLVANKFDEE